MKVGSATGEPGSTPATDADSASSSSDTRWKLCARWLASITPSSHASSSLRLCTAIAPGPPNAGTLLYV